MAVGPDPQIRIGVLGLFGSFLAQAAMRLDVFSLSTGGVNSSFEHGDEKSTMVKRSVCLFSTFRQHHPTSLTIFHRAKLSHWPLAPSSRCSHKIIEWSLGVINNTRTVNIYSYGSIELTVEAAFA